MDMLFPPVSKTDLPGSPTAKEIIGVNAVTTSRLVGMNASHMLISGNDRSIRDSFVESWFQNNAGDISILYFHDGNEYMPALFRQLIPDSLQLGGTTLSEYDPLRGIPLEEFFNELISRDPSLSGRVSSSYIKGLASLLLADHYEPTLYRLNCYASKDIGAILRRHEDDMEEEAYAVVSRYLRKNQSIIDSTLDYLEMLCTTCGNSLNTESMLKGKSIFSSLMQGSGVCIDTRILSNPITAALISTQLHFADQSRIPYRIVVDVETMLPEALMNLLAYSGSARTALFACPNIWTIVNSSDNTFSRQLLSSQQISVFAPSGNMAFSQDLSKYLDTYWRENKTRTTGSHRGKNRKFLELFPNNSNGTNTGLSISYTRETLMSANELRKLPTGTCMIIAQNVVPIIECAVVS